MGAPVKHTCPDIDSVIKSIRNSLRICADSMKSIGKGEPYYDCFDDIDTELRGVEDSLEELRNANSSLRDWGEGLEDKVNELDLRVDDLEDQLNTLQQKLDESQKEVTKLNLQLDETTQ